MITTNIYSDINNIEPIYLYQYLQDHGWKEDRKIEDFASILTMKIEEQLFSLLLPLKKDIPDFDSRILDVFRTLEIVEKTPQSELIKVFINSNSIAQQKEREILSLRFQFISEAKKHEFPAKRIGDILVQLQNLFDATGQIESGIESSKGKIKEEIINATQISVFETFKGSFGIKLCFPPINQTHLFEEPLQERIAKHFLNLVDLSNKADKELLKQLLLKLKKRTASQYRKFLMSLISAEVNFYTDWGSLNPNAGGYATLSFENIINTVDFINKMEEEEPEEYTIQGELVAANKNKNNLELEDIKDKIKYSANISDSISNIELTIGKLYSATLREITSINPATCEEKIERTVIKLSYLQK